MKRLTSGLIVIAEAALLSLGVIYLAAYFGWSFVAEAGGVSG